MDEEVFEVDQDKIAEERFKRWLTSVNETVLHESTLAKFGLSDELKQLKGMLSKVFDDNDESIPKWLRGESNNQYVAKSNDVIKALEDVDGQMSSMENLKFKLRQLSTPHVLSCLNHFKSTFDNSNSITSDAMDIDSTAPVETSVPEVQLENYAITLNPTKNANIVEKSVDKYLEIIEGKHDVVSKISRLSDIRNRFYRSFKRDETHLNTLVRIERKRKDRSARLLSARATNLEELNGILSTANSTNLIPKVLSTVKVEYGRRMSELHKAQVEEEQARKIYEAAIKKRQTLAYKVLETEDIWNSVHSQRRTCTELSEARVELEKYNSKVSNERLEFLESFQKLINAVQTDAAEKIFKSETVDLYSKMFNWWKNRLTSVENSLSGAHSDSNLVKELRIGIEMVRMCDQVNSEHDNSNGLSSLFAQLKLDMEVLSKNNANPAPTHGKTVSLTNSTVVLYFDHLVHGTPDNHVEIAARTESCMQAIRAQSINSKKKELVEPNDRNLMLCCCNDVIAPPSWCLLLVHCPDYMKRLWDLNTEARSNDLFCPLEFDTEWESDSSDTDGDAGMEVSDNDEAKSNLARSSVKSKNLSSMLHEFYKSLSSELSGELSDLAVKNRVFGQIDNILHSYSADKSLLIAKKGLSRSDSIAKSKDDALSFVSTPYGVGELIKRRADGIVEVQLDYGVGYFKVQAVHLIKVDTSNSLSAISNVIASTPKANRDVDDEQIVNDTNVYTDNRRNHFASGSFFPVKKVVKDKPAPVKAFVYNTAVLAKVKELIIRHGSQRVVADLISVRREYLNIWINQRATALVIKYVETAALEYLKKTEGYVPEEIPAELPEVESVELGKRERDSSESDEESVSEMATPESDTPMRKRRRGMGPEDYTGDKFQPKSKESELLRSMVQRIRGNFHLSQTALAETLSKTYDIPLHQTGLSSWMLYRVPLGTDVRLCVVFILWLYDNESLLEQLVPNSLEKRRVVLKWLITKIDSAPRLSESVRRMIQPLIAREGSALATLKVASFDETIDKEETLDNYDDIDTESSVISTTPVQMPAFESCASSLDTMDANVESNSAAAIQSDRAMVEQIHPDLSNGIRVLHKYVNLIAAGSAMRIPVSILSSVCASSINAASKPCGGFLWRFSKGDDNSILDLKSINELHEMKVNLKLSSTPVKLELLDKVKSKESEFDPIGNNSVSVSSEIVGEDLVGVLCYPIGGKIDGDPETVEELHEFALKEMKRRVLSQTMAVEEAQLATINMGQPHLSRFLNRPTLTGSVTSRQLCVCLIQWLRKSRTKPTAKQMTGLDDINKELKCQYCGRSSNEFSSAFGFNRHISWCRSKQGNENNSGTLPFTAENSEKYQLVQTVKTVFGATYEYKEGDAVTMVLPMDRTKFRVPDANWRLFRIPCSLCESNITVQNKLGTDVKNISAEKMKEDLPVSSENKVILALQQPGMSVNSSSEKNIADDTECDKTVEEGKEVSKANFPAGSFEGVEMKLEFAQLTFLLNIQRAIQCSRCTRTYHIYCLASKGVNIYPNPHLWSCSTCRSFGVSDAVSYALFDKRKTLSGKLLFYYETTELVWKRTRLIGKCGFPNGRIGFYVQPLASDYRYSGDFAQELNHIKDKMSSNYIIEVAVGNVYLKDDGFSIEIHNMLTNKTIISSVGESVKSLPVVAKKTEPVTLVVDPPILIKEEETVSSDSDIDGSGYMEYNRGNAVKISSRGSKRSNASHSLSCDTYVGPESLAAALCTAGSACRAVDIVMQGNNTNAFVCMRPPGHHAGRYGCTKSCITSGFCLFNNAAIALTYARVQWGLKRIAIVDIDVHFGNGTADICRRDPNAFFASVHMVYGDHNTASYFPCCGRATEPAAVQQSNKSESVSQDAQSSGGYRCVSSHRASESMVGFYPAGLGITEISDNYVSVGVFPLKWKTTHPPVFGDSARALSANFDAFKGEEFCKQAYLSGSKGFRQALMCAIIPKMEAFHPELLIISAGFDGYKTDPLGGHYGLNTADYKWVTRELINSMDKIAGGKGRGKVVSLMEGGYDVDSETFGLARCANAHVKSLRSSY